MKSWRNLKKYSLTLKFYCEQEIPHRKHAPINVSVNGYLCYDKNNARILTSVIISIQQTRIISRNGNNSFTVYAFYFQFST